MKHVKTLNTRKLQNTIKKGGCGECQTSCQSACKTSCTVGNQTCEQYKQQRFKKCALGAHFFAVQVLFIEINLRSTESYRKR